ncbi:MAG: ABC transporter permease [Spirochaetia bacterium]|nr:ABC transporter permease [Spirochaetia bacterium]
MIKIALRQMLARKRQTALTLLGIVFGATAYIVMSGILLGFRAYLIEQLINNDSHIRIQAKNQIILPHSLDEWLLGKDERALWIVPPSGRRDNARIENPGEWYRRLDRDSAVEAWSQQLIARSIFRRGNILESGRLIGILPARQARVTTISQQMIAGDFRDIGESGNRLIMGDGLRMLLGARVSETVFVSVGRGEPIAFKIVGVFQTGNRAVDETTCYAYLSDVQRLNHTPGVISDIAVRLRDVALSNARSMEWKQISDENVRSWEETNATFFSIFKLQDAIRYSMTIAILVVAGFGIYNILNIVISQKKREIAILRSIGFESRDIVIIFLIQGLILGVAGGLLGMLLGYVVCTQLENLNFSNPLMQSKSGKMMVSYSWSIYGQAYLLAFLSTLFASVLPARAAGGLAPIEIIRGE